MAVRSSGLTAFAGVGDWSSVSSPLLGLAENEKRLRIDAVVLHGIRGGLAPHGVLKRLHVGDLGDDPGLVRPVWSRNVRTVMPIGPNTSSRFGELSQCSTSSTSWVMT